MVIHMFILRLAPLRAGERTEKTVNIAVGAADPKLVKVSYQAL